MPVNDLALLYPSVAGHATCMSLPTGLSEKIYTATQQLRTWGFKLVLGSNAFRNASVIYMCAYVLIIVQENFMF